MSRQLVGSLVLAVIIFSLIREETMAEIVHNDTLADM